MIFTRLSSASARAKALFSTILLPLFAVAADKEIDGAHTVEMAVPKSMVASHKFATWILDRLHDMLAVIGLENNQTIEDVAYVAIIVLVALLIGVIVRKTAVYICKKFIQLRHKEPDFEALAIRTVHKCAHIISPIVFLALVPFAFNSEHGLLSWLLRIGGIYALICLAIGICAIFKFIWVKFDERENTDNHPLKGIYNVGCGLVWIIIVIISISILIDRSPMTLLAGLGAFAAALMLIFKDSILGLVAGIQLSQNDMLRVGDWIVVPSTIANGVVVDVTLTVVKVQNWDNTMVMLPPYTLVSTSFQNWRNMYAVGARYIDYNLYVDRSSIRPATDELIASVTEKYPLMRDFVEKLQKAREAVGDASEKIFTQEYNNSHSPNGTLDTNLGLFRAYTTCYLIAHPQINTDTQDMLIGIDPPQPYGTAININCYSKQTSWAPYEAVKAEIIEHLQAVAPDFGIVFYNAPDRNSFTLTSGSETPAGPRPIAPAQPSESK